MSPEDNKAVVLGHANRFDRRGLDGLRRVCAPDALVYGVLRSDLTKKVRPPRHLSTLSSLTITLVCLLIGCSTLDKEATLRRDLNLMIELLESGRWNEMADQFVVPSRVAEAKEGLQNEMNRQITLAVFKELATKNATFSKDGQSATIQIDADDIPPRWRFRNVAGRWQFADRF